MPSHFQLDALQLAVLYYVKPVLLTEILFLIHTTFSGTILKHSTKSLGVLSQLTKENGNTTTFCAMPKQV